MPSQQGKHARVMFSTSGSIISPEHNKIYELLWLLLLLHQKKRIMNKTLLTISSRAANNNLSFIILCTSMHAAELSWCYLLHTCLYGMFMSISSIYTFISATQIYIMRKLILSFLHYYIVAVCEFV